MSAPDVHLLVRAGGRTYAIPGERVVEVARHDDTRELARIGLDHLLGGARAEVGPLTCTVLVQHGGEIVGLVADEATDVVAFGAHDLVAPPDFGPRIATPWLRALARTGETFAVVLDVDGLLGAAR